MDLIPNHFNQILSVTHVLSCFFIEELVQGVKHNLIHVGFHAFIGSQVFVLVVFLGFYLQFPDLSFIIVVVLHFCFLELAFYELNFSYQFMIFLGSGLSISSAVIKS